MQLTFSWKLSNAKKFKIRQDTFNNILIKTWQVINGSLLSTRTDGIITD